MEKQQLLSEVSKMFQSGEISKQDLQGIIGEKNSVEKVEVVKDYSEGALSLLKNVTAVQILYYFGGLVAFLGVVILLGQNWSLLSDPVKLMSTLVMGGTLIASGIWLTKNEKLSGVGQAFILAGSLIFPVGIYVVLRISFIDTTNLNVQAAITAWVAAMFLAGYWGFKKVLLLVFGIGWATAFYFLLGSLLLQGQGTDYYSYYSENYYEYRVLIAAVSYLLISYYFAKSNEGIKKLAGLLNAFGIVGLLGSTYVLMFDNVVWELAFPVLALGAMLGSVKLHSRMFLISGAIGLISYIFYITGAYFAESVGWPVALIVAGFGLIAIGYFAVQVNKKYLQKKA